MRRPLTALTLASALSGLVAVPALAGGSSSPPTIAAGVTIAGLDVAGLTETHAASAVRTWFARPLAFRFRDRRWAATPKQLHARGDASLAAAAALGAAPGTTVALRVGIRPYYLRRYVVRLARTFRKAPEDSRLRLRHHRPFITRAARGRRVVKHVVRRAIRSALLANTRGPIRLAVEKVKPKVTRTSFGSIVVIRRGSHRLYLYRNRRFVRSFGVAVGQPRYPTPLGRFTIVTKQRNPWWYPPDSDWAAGAQPIPPGPGNPLGTRWMGLSASGVGIHGTPDAGSIGYSVSHGCIRMRIPEAERLFRRVRVGTTVFIIRA